MFRPILQVLSILLFTACTTNPNQEVINDSSVPNSPYIVVLGIAQDGGIPHPGCDKECCINKWDNPNDRKMVASLGIVDPDSKACWMIDATPDFPLQQKHLISLAEKESQKLDGIFLTHGHIGHYAGLMYLGKESMGSKNVPVYAMPRMKSFLEQNGPWNLLVELENIHLLELVSEKFISVNDHIKIKALEVPHRGEYTETIGIVVEGPKKSLLYIPDIDHWESWDEEIVKMVEQYDYIFIDGTFYSGDELPGRDMSKIPHPTISHSMDILNILPPETRSKVHFIHFNHTNPVLNQTSKANQSVLEKGYNLAFEGQVIPL